MVDEIEDSLSEMVEAVDADCGYFECTQVRGLEEKGKDVCVGEGKAKNASSRGDLEHFVAGGDFVYDAERDVFVCPFGNEHVLIGFRERENGKKWRVYKSVRSCTGCPRRKECFGRARNKFHRLERIADYPWLFEYRQKFLEPQYQRRLLKRSLIEHNFGHLKHNLGFRRFNLRGLCGAKIEAFLAGCASVLRRLWGDFCQFSAESWAAWSKRGMIQRDQDERWSFSVVQSADDGIRSIFWREECSSGLTSDSADVAPRAALVESAAWPRTMAKSAR